MVTTMVLILIIYGDHYSAHLNHLWCSISKVLGGMYQITVLTSWGGG